MATKRTEPELGRATRGPLTLAQARAMVKAAAVATRPVTKAGRAAAPRRGQSRAAAVPAPAPATLAAVATERRKLAIQQRKERRQRLRDYTATLALLQSRGVKGLPAAEVFRPPRRRAPGAPVAAPSGPLRVFAEGDSWFDYPAPFFGGGIVPRLENRLGVPILNLAKAGDESRYMLGVEQRQVIAHHLREGCPDGQPWDLMMFSGGGNDIAANPLVLWLKEFDASVMPRALLNGPRYRSVLALIRAAYEDLIDVRDLLSPQTHLAFHGYDFAIPDGRGICGLGPWLKPAFDLRGFPSDLGASSQVVRAMLEQFAEMIETLESRPRVSLIHTQGTLAATSTSWHNEMHPSKSGFNQISDVFHAHIKALFPGRVLN